MIRCSTLVASLTERENQWSARLHGHAPEIDPTGPIETLYRLVRLKPPKRILACDSPIEAVAIMALHHVKDCGLGEHIGRITKVGEALYEAIRTTSALTPAPVPLLQTFAEAVALVAEHITKEDIYDLSSRLFEQIGYTGHSADLVALWPLARIARSRARTGGFVASGSIIRTESRTSWAFPILPPLPNPLPTLSYLAPWALESEKDDNPFASAGVGFRELAASFPYLCTYSDAAVLARWPTRFLADQQDRVHCADGPAMEFHGKTPLFAWHGISVPRQAIEDPASFRVEDVLAELNIERRRALIEIVGLDRIVSELPQRVMHQDVDGAGQPRRLIRCRLPVTDPDGFLVAVEVVDPSTGRKYLLRVPPQIGTCHEAVAWTFGLEPKQYGPAKET